MKKQKKNKSAKARLVAFGLYGITSLCFAASLCGTFAWYTYTTRTGLAFEGVSVTDAGSLEIGIVSDVKIPDYEDYGFVEDTWVHDKIIYWSYTGLTAERVNHVIKANGSATNTLATVTSGKYHGDGKDFKLYSSPTHGSNYIDDANTNSMVEFAYKYEYVTLPLAFRFGNTEIEGAYVPGKRIFLSDVTLSTEENISNSLRIFSYHNSKDNGYLINPSADKNGSTTVGGILDLNTDGSYDTFVDEHNRICEFPYGEFVDGYSFNETPFETSTDIDRDDLTTFDSNHKQGTYGLDDSSKPETADYIGVTDFENHRISITTTNDEGYYGFVTFVIFIEGWDLSVVNSNFGHAFTMDLTFEMD